MFTVSSSDLVARDVLELSQNQAFKGFHKEVKATGL